MKAQAYSQSGKKVKEIEIPDTIFNVSWNADLVHQVLTSMWSNARTPIAHAKDISEQRGGGRKPWRQKGTGRARHGTRRSPLWRSGGVTFGPRNERNFVKHINKKMKTKALFTVLSEKLRRGQVIFLDSITLDAIKAKDARNILENLNILPGFEAIETKKNAVHFVLSEADEKIAKSFRNFGNVFVSEMRNLNIISILNYKFLIIVDPKKSIGILESRIIKGHNQESKIKNQEKKKRVEEKPVVTVA